MVIVDDAMNDVPKPLKSWESGKPASINAFQSEDPYLVSDASISDSRYKLGKRVWVRKIRADNFGISGEIGECASGKRRGDKAIVEEGNRGGSEQKKRKVDLGLEDYTESKQKSITE
ncbi:hypothetical protein Q3G72_007660 [Acer saccharum]|nr:hypothetical protein Q3G72_007660 [Acer saccharum]